MCKLSQHSGWCNNQNVIAQYDLLLLEACACVTHPLLRNDVKVVNHTTPTHGSATKHHIICIYLILLAQILCIIVWHGSVDLHTFPIACLFGTALNVPLRQVT